MIDEWYIIIALTAAKVSFIFFTLAIFLIYSGLDF